MSKKKVEDTLNEDLKEYADKSDTQTIIGLLMQIVEELKRLK